MSKTSIDTTNTTLSDEVLMSRIYVFRDHKVMLDRDLAELYGVTTGNLNKAVKRNIKRFPEDFMFQLNEDEFKNLIFQNGTSSWGGTRKPPYTFTEQGVAMLSGVLNSDRAIAVNIQIMRIFTKLRQFLADNSNVQHQLTKIRLAIEQIAKKQKGHDQNIELLFEYIDRLQDNTKPQSNNGVTVVKGFDIGGTKKMKE